MKKTRVIAIIATAFLMMAALAMTVSAKWWEGNPFADVKSDAWYYDAVRISKENGLFNGTTDTTFAPDTGMTRAMFVTVLSAADGYDASEYTETPFADVPSGAWYTAPVAWAAEKGITGGTGANTFSPDRVITREELVAMLRKYAQIAGYPTDAGEGEIDGFADAVNVADWAKDAFRWAYNSGIVSGAASGDSLLLAPKMTATRSQVAQMMVKLLATKPVRTINGNDISLYTIVYNANERASGGDYIKDAAEALAKNIKLSLGFDLPVVTDETAPVDLEIVVGRTNREDDGLVTVDRDAFENDQQFICEVQGDRLVIAGIDSYPRAYTDRRHNNVFGTANAVVYFCENVLGMEFYTAKNTLAAPDPIIALDDGWTYVDGPTFSSRVIFVNSDGMFERLSTDIYYDQWGCSTPHKLGNLVTGILNDNIDKGMPCLSEQENIDSLIRNVRNLLETERQSLNCIGLIQSDSDSYCTCEKCREAYRKYGSRCAPMILAINQVCEALEDDYPDVKYMTWAYTWSAKPPKGIELHKNIIIVYNTLLLCPAHTYSDASCPFNESSSTYIKQWGDLASEMFVWDHTSAFGHYLVPFPDWGTMLTNAGYFDDHGATGVFLNGGGAVVDFMDLRAYLYSQVFRDPQMSDEEYYYHMDSFLRYCYGDGWKNLRAYLDKLCELSNSKHHQFSADAGAYYDFDRIAADADEIDALWDNAEAGARTDAQLEMIRYHRVEWLYLMQCGTYNSRYISGTDEQKEAYKQKNTELYELILKYDLEVRREDIHFSADKSPENW